ncbi:WbqC family protein [Adhaeribacter soli]|uniref:WbqC family protein n=1 Tax=Adhaeribacter soli TaxID=2607655 RepID=A0A5N1J4V3_9BACT|nr:WbqC family protein [Adhaeribacter soli]KAA9340834.1 WbqC family protein [Adhaeribacter soli]
MPESGKKVAILQSSYIPWKGYFDLINSVDEFVLYDCVQYTDRDWRNRNRIKTPNGLQWLTIPVHAPYLEKLSVSEVKVLNQKPLWQEKHWKSLVANYSKAPYFELYRQTFEDLYLKTEFEYLSQVNEAFIQTICDILDIKTCIRNWQEFEISGDKNERLVNICKQAGASVYLSGPAAQAYLKEEAFAAAGIKVEWMNYNGYPDYPQFFPPFVHEVSILDLLFQTGANAKDYMLSFSGRNNNIRNNKVSN